MRLLQRNDIGAQDKEGSEINQNGHLDPDKAVGKNLDSAVRIGAVIDTVGRPDAECAITTKKDLN